MTKSITKQQLEMMVNSMAANPSIASGFSKGSKASITQFWKALQVDLNSAGPPVKNVSEWKKVWLDQKKYVRKKIAGNMAQRRGTGSWPCRERKLSPTEETICDLICAREALEGIGGTRSFGLRSQQHAAPLTKEATASPTSIRSIDDCIAVSSSEEDSPSKSVRTPKRKRAMTTEDGLQMELESVVKNDVHAILQEINENFKTMNIIQQGISEEIKQLNLAMQWK